MYREKVWYRSRQHQESYVSRTAFVKEDDMKMSNENQEQGE